MKAPVKTKWFQTSVIREKWIEANKKFMILKTGFDPAVGYSATYAYKIPAMLQNIPLDAVPSMVEQYEKYAIECIQLGHYDTAAKTISQLRQIQETITAISADV